MFLATQRQECYKGFFVYPAAAQYTYIYNAVSSLGTSNILSIIKLTSPELIVYKTSLFILIIGAVVGMFGSVKAVRKYLTV